MNDPSLSGLLHHELEAHLWGIRVALETVGLPTDVFISTISYSLLFASSVWNQSSGKISKSTSLFWSWGIDNLIKMAYFSFSAGTNLTNPWPSTFTPDPGQASTWEQPMWISLAQPGCEAEHWLVSQYWFCLLSLRRPHFCLLSLRRPKCGWAEVSDIVGSTGGTIEDACKEIMKIMYWPKALGNFSELRSVLRHAAEGVSHVNPGKFSKAAQLLRICFMTEVCECGNHFSFRAVQESWKVEMPFTYKDPIVDTEVGTLRHVIIFSSHNKAVWLSSFYKWDTWVPGS